MEQKTFEEIKEELLLRAKKAGACQIGYAMGLRSQCKADILKAITDNWSWVLRTARIVDAEYLEDNFDEEDLAEAGIYTQKYHSGHYNAAPHNKPPLSLFRLALAIAV